MKITKILPLLLLLLATQAARPQSADDIKSIRRDLDSVRDSLKVIQNELETIKKLLQQPAQPAQPRPFQEAALSVEGAPFLGQKNAKVTVVEFSDYQCPFCARHFQQTLPQIVKEYVDTGKVKYVFRDHPLESIHPAALKAAEAARCGGEQGKYWEMHDEIFRNQKQLTPADLEAYAQKVGLDGGKFKACLEGGKQAEKVRKDLADGAKVGARGTPAFFLGLTVPNATTFKAVKFINGAQSYAQFKEAIDSLLTTGKSD